MRYNEIFSTGRPKKIIFAIWFVPALLLIMQIVQAVREPDIIDFNCQSTISTSSINSHLLTVLRIFFLTLDYGTWAASFAFLFKVYNALPDCNLTQHSKRWTKWTVFSTAFRGMISFPLLIATMFIILNKPGSKNVAMIFLQLRVCGAIISPIPYAFCLKEYKDGLKRFRSRLNAGGHGDSQNLANQNELDFNLNDLLARLAGEAGIQNSQMDNVSVREGTFQDSQADNFQEGTIQMDNVSASVREVTIRQGTTQNSQMDDAREGTIQSSQMDDGSVRGTMF